MYQCFFLFCLFGAPAYGVVPDGAGGFVPFTNSRVMPDGLLRPYDPALDGPYPSQPVAGAVAPGYPGYADPGFYGAPPPPDSRTWVRPYPGPVQ